jgi:hypothetical protein
MSKAPGTCDIVLCFFYFKNKETRENYFYNVDFYERKTFESK